MLLTKVEQPGAVAYKKNFDDLGIIHSSPEINPNRPSPNKPDPVSGCSDQQFNPPKGQLNSHPKFPSLKAPRFRENSGSGDEHDIEAENLCKDSEDPVDCRDSIESLSKMSRKARQHVRMQGWPHEGANNHQVQDQDGSLADTMCHEAFGASQQRTEDQSNAHRDLNRKIQIREKTGVSTEKTVHSAHFLKHAGPQPYSRFGSPRLDSCLSFSADNQA
jgi:hypothetical protein